MAAISCTSCSDLDRNDLPTNNINQVTWHAGSQLASSPEYDSYPLRVRVACLRWVPSDSPDSHALRVGPAYPAAPNASSSWLSDELSMSFPMGGNCWRESHLGVLLYRAEMVGLCYLLDSCKGSYKYATAVSVWLFDPTEQGIKPLGLENFLDYISFSGPNHPPTIATFAKKEKTCRFHKHKPDHLSDIAPNNRMVPPFQSLSINQSPFGLGNRCRSCLPMSAPCPPVALGTFCWVRRCQRRVDENGTATRKKKKKTLKALQG